MNKGSAQDDFIMVECRVHICFVPSSTVCSFACSDGPRARLSDAPIYGFFSDLWTDLSTVDFSYD